jgi:hypothetical protein
LSRLPPTRRTLGLAELLVAALAVAGFSPRYVGYAPARWTVPVDSAPRTVSEPKPRSFQHLFGAVIPGYLSPWGLPPVQGRFTLSDTGLVFHSARGAGSTRASTVSLGYVDHDNGRAHYVFRVDAGVFETDTPGILLEVIGNPVWLKNLRPPGRVAPPVVVHAADSVTPLSAARQIAASPYADSLYAVFGRPSAPVGLIGRRGRLAGRLGEYIAARDSLALDPGRMMGETQLRHALAHELGHRWQTRAKAQLATLWAGVPTIRDSKRYGYREPMEHQAEAIAFAVDFLQTTAATQESPASSFALLEHYELLVPGTRILVRYLLLQPIYQNHPLRSLLTTDRVTYALEK